MNRVEYAVLIAGPIRHIIKVIDQFVDDEIRSFSFYIFLWENETGNKVRKPLPFDVIEDSRIQCLIRDKSYSTDQWGEIVPMRFGEKGQSSIANILGMFYSMNMLVSLVLKAPKRFDFLIRARTDMIIDIDYTELERVLGQSNVDLAVSINPMIPTSWLSDHLMVGNVRAFSKLWIFPDWSTFISEYKRSGFNPEKALAIRSKNVRVVRVFKRYVDYYIVYNEFSKNDPPELREKYMFPVEMYDNFDLEEFREKFFNYLHQKQLRSSQNSIYKVFRVMREEGVKKLVFKIREKFGF